MSIDTKFKKGQVPWNAGTGQKIEKACLTCRDKFTSYSCQKRKYCSKDCKHSYKSGNTPIICSTCGTHFLKSQASSGRFCSKGCYWKSLKIYGEKPKCLDCAKPLNSHRSCRCAKCNFASKVGANHWNWKGGNRREIHSLSNPKYRTWRKAVFTRDKYVCRIANENCSGMLQAHHILRWADFPEIRYEVNNGISLCQFHHPRKKLEEQRLALVFRSLII